MQARRMIEAMLYQADVRIDGDRPWDIQVHDDRLFPRVIRQGSLGLGEAYVEGWWDVEQLDMFFERVLRAELYRSFRYTPAVILLYLKSLLTNRQIVKRSFQIGEHHYDIGNDLYRIMLDSRLVYTGAYWDGARNLDEAQEAKLEMVCRKIDLQPGDRVLDIGCGWGSFARYAAETYGAEVVGITISRQQVELGRENCQGLPVEIRLQDYRELDETFDHIVSLGMIEHVGSKNYRSYFRIAHDCLADSGTFLLQTIGSNLAIRNTDPWINKYIFPNSMVPAASQLTGAFQGLFVMEDWHNFGPDYDRTLRVWADNVKKGWDRISENYPSSFYRLWTYYLLMSAGSFRARKNQLWQILLTKKGWTDRRPDRHVYSQLRSGEAVPAQVRPVE